MERETVVRAPSAFPAQAVCVGAATAAAPREEARGARAVTTTATATHVQAATPYQTTSASGVVQAAIQAAIQVAIQVATQAIQAIPVQAARAHPRRANVHLRIDVHARHI